MKLGEMRGRKCSSEFLLMFLDLRGKYVFLELDTDVVDYWEFS